MRSRYALAAGLAAAGILAGCGTNNADTAHVVPPPSTPQTLTYTDTSTSTSSSSTAGAVALHTPKSGPLATEPKVTVPSGAAPTKLVVKDIVKGTGAAAATGDTLTVNYVGVLYKGGKTFDASWQRNQAFTLPGPLGAGSVIKGWDQGLVGMRVGGRRELIVPPSLGYGSAANGSIPSNSTLIFVVDLLGLTPPTGATGVTGATAATGATG